MSESASGVSIVLSGAAMSHVQLSQGELLRMVISRFLGAFLVSGVMFFLPAGTLQYPEAWAVLGIIFVPMSLVLVYLLRNDPGLLARRMRLREKETQQKLIVKLSYIPFLLAYILPGFDKRFGWSNVPWGVVVAADILALLGYGIVFLVFRENRYASRVIEVEQGQTVIESGPYALIRHPMYSGTMLMFISCPLALGSYWAMIPAMLVIPVLVARILNEESVLLRDLHGYQEYMHRTRYRLIPGIW
jgi:protein-S-isoprenylcysteine O-methyltransferase Ste14